MVWLFKIVVQINVCNFSNPQSFRGALPPWAHYQGSVLDPLGTLSGPQTPRILTPPPNHKSWIRPWWWYIMSIILCSHSEFASMSMSSAHVGAATLIVPWCDCLGHFLLRCPILLCCSIYIKMLRVFLLVVCPGWYKYFQTDGSPILLGWTFSVHIP